MYGWQVKLSGPSLTPANPRALEMSIAQIVKCYTVYLLVCVCAETPFGNVDSCFAYFKDLVLCHAVNVSVSCLLCHAAGTVPVSLSVSNFWLQFLFYILRESSAKCIVVTRICVSLCVCVCLSVCLSDCPRPYAHTTARARM